MAVFVANKATEDFYFEKEGPQSPTVQKIKDENADENLFSVFISKELKELEAWYKEKDRSDEEKTLRLEEIKKHFQKDLLPKLKTKLYSNFPNTPLNNARLLVYKTYVSDLTQFEEIFEKVGKDYRRFLEECKNITPQ